MKPGPLLVALLAVATPAWAGPIGPAGLGAEVSYEDQAPRAEPWGSDLRLTLRAQRVSLEPESAGLDTSEPCASEGLTSLGMALPTELELELFYRLPEQGPESLGLWVRPHAVLSLYVTADLNSELPRLDAMDGETYYTVGFEVHLVPQLRVFVEDFQPASGTVGGSASDEPPPERSWDGHQIGYGLRFAPLPGLEVELSGVAYTLSASQRSGSAGLRGGLSYGF